MRKILHLICYTCTVLVEQTLWECDSPSLNPWLSYQNHTFHKLLYFFLTILNLHVTDKNSYDTPASAIVHSVFMIKTYRIIFKAFLTQLWKKQISIWKSYKIDIKLERANLIHPPPPPPLQHMAITGHKGSHENQFSIVTDNDDGECIYTCFTHWVTTSISIIS